MNNKTVLAMTTALLLAGSAAMSASAQSGYYDRYGYHPYERTYGYTYANSDRDCDGINDRYDRYARDINDDDCDGVPNRYDNRRYDSRYAYSRHDNRYRSHRWSVGAYLPREYYGGSYYIDYEPYGLYRPDYGYRWNRVGDDVYLVETRNGMVVEVRYDFFH